LTRVSQSLAGTGSDMGSFVSSTQTVPDLGAVPQHIAIILDGNGRWATDRRLPRTAGHRKGVETVRSTVESCARLGVRYLTLFAFSSENWRRPADEVSLLMRLFISALQREVTQLHRNDLRLRIVGDRTRFDRKLQAAIMAAEALTCNNRGMTLTTAVVRGDDVGRPIGEDELAAHLSMHYAPEPDLFIRTGGEQRISNFLIWQLAYSELYFCDRYWPDFDQGALMDALAWYRRRERRFGRTSAQLAGTAA